MNWIFLSTQESAGWGIFLMLLQDFWEAVAGLLFPTTIHSKCLPQCSCCCCQQGVFNAAIVPLSFLAYWGLGFFSQIFLSIWNSFQLLSFPFLQENNGKWNVSFHVGMHAIKLSNHRWDSDILVWTDHIYLLHSDFGFPPRSSGWHFSFITILCPVGL